MEINNILRPFKCIERDCRSLGFMKVGYLLDHLKTTHICSSEHILRHYENMNFLACPICQIPFIGKNGVAVHMRKTHENIQNVSGSSILSNRVTGGERRQTSQNFSQNSNFQNQNLLDMSAGSRTVIETTAVNSPVSPSINPPTNSSHFLSNNNNIQLLINNNNNSNFNNNITNNSINNINGGIIPNGREMVDVVDQTVLDAPAVVENTFGVNYINNHPVGANVDNPVIDQIIHHNDNDIDQTQVINIDNNIGDNVNEQDFVMDNSNISNFNDFGAFEMISENEGDQMFIIQQDADNLLDINETDINLNDSFDFENIFNNEDIAENLDVRVNQGPTNINNKYRSTMNRNTEELHQFVPDEILLDIPERVYYTKPIRYIKQQSKVLNGMSKILTVLLDEINAKYDAGMEATIEVKVFLMLPRVIKLAEKDKKAREVLYGRLMVISQMTLVDMVIELVKLYSTTGSNGIRSNTNQDIDVDPANKIVNRCKSLIKKGLGGKAYKILQNSISSEVIISDETKNALINLHPQKDISLSASGRGRVTSKRVSIDLVAEVIDSLPKESGAGLSGMTFELIKLVWNDNANFRNSLVKFINNVLLGKLKDTSIWLAGRLIPLRDKSTLKIRPIAVSECIMRLANRAISKLFKDQILKVLAPIQLGYGVNSGSEVIVHLLQTYAKDIVSSEEELVIKSLDLKNAFNSVSRDAIYKGVKDLVPELIQTFINQYGTKSELIVNDEVLCSSSTGVKQGDPLSGIFFCLGIQNILKKVGTSNPNIKVIAFFDDLYILGSKVEAERAYGQLTNELEKVDLLVNHQKSWTVNKTEMLCQLAFRPLKSVLAMQPEMGNVVKSIQDEWIEPLDKFKDKFDTKDLLAIIKHSITNVPNYWARTIPYKPDTFLHFDKKLLSIIAESLDVSSEGINERTKSILRLPVRMGGVAITQYNDIHKLCWAASYATFCNFNAAHSIYNNLQTNELYMEYVALNTNGASQSSLVNNHYASIKSSMIESEPDPLVKGWLKSQANKASSMWIHDPANNMNHESFTGALKLKLLMEHTYLQDGEHLSCTCGAVQESQICTAIHSLSCNSHTGLRTERHDHLRDRLSTILGNPKLFGQTFREKEPSLKVQKQGEAPRTVRGDLLWRSRRGTTFVFEISVTGRLNQSDVVESEKIHKYDHRIGTYVVLPIVVEITGRLSEGTIKALKVIRENKLMGANDNPVVEIRRALSMIIWSFNQKFIKAILRNPDGIRITDSNVNN